MIITDDLSWSTNTKALVKRAVSRMIILRKLVEFQINANDMIIIYILFIRSVLEQSSVVWSSSLTIEDCQSLERVQKIALRTIYQEKYISYDNALDMSKLSTMKSRYEHLLLRFATKCTQNDRTRDMLPINSASERTRHQEKYFVPFASKERFYKSTIPTMARLLNGKENK